MSDALKRLSELDGRLKAATPGPWRVGYLMRRCKKDHVHGGKHCVYEADGWSDYDQEISSESGVIVVSHNEMFDMYRPNADLIAHAPADLALLAKVARDAAESECAIVVLVNVGLIDRAGIESQEFHDKICRRCPVRRELAGGVRSEA